MSTSRALSSVSSPVWGTLPGAYSRAMTCVSSVETSFQVFYTDSRIIPYEFSEDNSIRNLIKKGKNSIQVILDYKYLGHVLRIDPMGRVGSMEIISLSIEDSLEC